MAVTKIATCCYCGTRAALVLTGDVRHELACSSCGAPLHDMKHLKAAGSDVDRKSRQKAVKPSEPLSKSQRKVRKKAKKKSKKSTARRFFGEAFDLLEDIFD